MMKRLLFLLSAITGFFQLSATHANEPDSAYIFAYATNQNAGRNGLHIAWSIDRKTWHPIGPERTFLRCEYASDGKGKRMLSPYLMRSKNGMWHCVWNVNEHQGIFAHCQSADLISWEQQVFPETGENEESGNCTETVISFDDGRQDYVIAWKSQYDKKTQAYSCRTKDFRTYSSAQPTKNYFPDYHKATVSRTTESGTLHRVAWNEVEALIQADKMAKYKAIQNAERLSINPELFKDTITLNVTPRPEESKKISDMLIGVFFEDINYGADGGLYAELVQNRDFEYSPNDIGREKNWTATNSWSTGGKDLSFDIDTVAPLHAHNPHYAVLDIKEKGHGLVNDGFDGIPVKAGEKYDFSVFARSTSNKRGKIIVRLLDEDGKVIGEARTGKISKTWNKLTAVVKATDSAVNGCIEVIPDMEGEVNLDMVSLFPQKTFKNRKNGMRADLAQAIADIHPRFVRFPGGCVAHGSGLDNIYRWENTNGPLESRKPLRNLWGYHQTMGLGYYEYFQFCEDIGAEPLPVVAAGVCCQNSYMGQEGIPMEEMPEYIESILNLIEWANGDPSESPWAKMRAEAGHPKPFNLKYLGVGNEDLITPVFEERFTMIFKAIKEKYPEIQVVGTSGPFSEGPDYVEGWKVASKLGVPLVDEHYYQPAGWFLNNHDYYDRYDRSKPKVYLGEYATHIPGKGNNIETALLEAYHLIGCERNGDIVSMTSYAPLLAKDWHTRWRPDLIYFNNMEVKPGTSYYTQLLFGQNSGNEYIPSVLTLSDNRDDVRKRIGISVVKDSLSQDLILKFVNLLPVKVQATIDLAPLGITGKQDATKTVLSGMPDDWKARPETSPVAIEPQYRDELPAYSLTVVRLKSKP